MSKRLDEIETKWRERLYLGSRDVEDLLAAARTADALVADIEAGSPGGHYGTTRLVTAFRLALKGEPQGEGGGNGAG